MLAYIFATVALVIVFLALSSYVTSRAPSICTVAHLVPGLLSSPMKSKRHRDSRIHRESATEQKKHRLATTSDISEHWTSRMCRAELSLLMRLSQVACILAVGKYTWITLGQVKIAVVEGLFYVFSSKSLIPSAPSASSKSTSLVIVSGLVGTGHQDLGKVSLNI